VEGRENVGWSVAVIDRECTHRQWNASPLSTTPKHPSKVLSRRVKGDISYFAEIRHFSFALK
jgi:hypothetical protein